jgi:hypothetical protein
MALSSDLQAHPSVMSLTLFGKLETDIAGLERPKRSDELVVVVIFKEYAVRSALPKLGARSYVCP